MINYNKWFVIFLIIVLIISAIELAYSLYQVFYFYVNYTKQDRSTIYKNRPNILNTLRKKYVSIFLNFVSVLACIGMLVSILKYDYSFSRNVIYGVGIVLFLYTFLNLIMLYLQIQQRINNKKKEESGEESGKEEYVVFEEEVQLIR